MPIYSAVIEPGATGDGVTTPVPGTHGWICNNQTPVVPTVTESLIADDALSAVTTSCVGPTCAPLGPHTLLCHPSRQAIVLDGGAPIDFFSLPAGLIVKSLNIQAILVQFFILGGSGARAEIFHGGSLVATYASTGSWPLNTIVFDESDLAPTGLYRAFIDQIKIILTSTVNDSLIANVDTISIRGNYIIWSVQLSLNPTAGLSGDEITIADGAGQLDQIEELTITQIDPVTGETTDFPIISIISRTAFEIVFVIPFGVDPSLPATINGLLNGVQFSGSVLLGILQILLTNGSGIYTLIPGKTSDTYYDRSVTPSVTIDLKIPDPMIKTGFVP